MSHPFAFAATTSSRAPSFERRIATRETPKFLGLFRASWRRYDDFEPEVLEKDLERIRHFYQRSGYYGAEVRAGRVQQDGKFVDIEILIREGRSGARPLGLAPGSRGQAARARPSACKERIALGPGDVFD